MARVSRLVIPGYSHHVTQRGNRRMKKISTEDNYDYYLELITRYKDEAGVEVWAYCLMPNHVHFVVVPRDHEGWPDCFGKCIDTIPGQLISENIGRGTSGRSAFTPSSWTSGTCWQRSGMLSLTR